MTKIAIRTMIQYISNSSLKSQVTQLKFQEIKFVSTRNVFKPSKPNLTLTLTKKNKISLRQTPKLQTFL